MRRIPFLLLAAATVLAVSGSALGSALGTSATPANSTLPTISGSARAGQTLSASSGSWSGTIPISYAYQWQRCNRSGSGCARSGARATRTTSPPPAMSAGRCAYG